MLFEDLFADITEPGLRGQISREVAARGSVERESDGDVDGRPAHGQGGGRRSGCA